MNPRLVSKRILVDKYKKLVEEKFKLGPGEEEVSVYLEGNPSVVVFAVDELGYLITVEQFRFAHRRRIIQLPMGFIDGGESVEDAARRELYEETGYCFDKCINGGEFLALPGESNRKVNFVFTKDAFYIGKKEERFLSKFEIFQGLKSKMTKLEDLQLRLERGEQVFEDMESDLAFRMFGTTRTTLININSKKVCLKS